MCLEVSGGGLSGKRTSSCTPQAPAKEISCQHELSCANAAVHQPAHLLRRESSTIITWQVFERYWALLEEFSSMPMLCRMMLSCCITSAGWGNLTDALDLNRSSGCSCHRLGSRKRAGPEGSPFTKKFSGGWVQTASFDFASGF